MIETQPKGAKVFVDNMYIGNSPVVMQDYKFATSTTYLRLEKEGYETVQTTICRDEQIDIGAAIAGVFFLYPWLWIFEYKPIHTFMLKPSNPNNSKIEEYYDNEDYIYVEDNYDNEPIDKTVVIQKQQTSNTYT